MGNHERSNRSTLRGKRVVLLGGTSGVGFAAAEAAAKEEASVVVASSRKERVDHAVSRLPQGAEGHVVDLSNETEVRAFFSHIGEFDHLVFSAGEPLQFESLNEINIDAARRLYDLRYWGALMAAKYGSPNMRTGGSITLVSGVAGTRPPKGLIVPSSICGAVEALTRALAIELRPIRVNAVAFGLMRTEMYNGIPEEDRNAMYKAIGDSLPVGHVGEPEDAAEAFLYLMREQYSTGQVIIVDGGSTLV
ncbi:SDR family oxidoreductase [Paenibacillus guangzhouensis]|uniref:SDR family oxidoreductase n=1 Tax=Paenibacillus guangzhouensis TaxID=1473112 RepID=UPI0012676AE2|nr:SDR family oxidoreductase [Paenibacillus guangzhouensis]